LHLVFDVKLINIAVKVLKKIILRCKNSVFFTLGAMFNKKNVAGSLILKKVVYLQAEKLANVKIIKN